MQRMQWDSRCVTRYDATRCANCDALRRDPFPDGLLLRESGAPQEYFQLRSNLYDASPAVISAAEGGAHLVTHLTA